MTISYLNADIIDRILAMLPDFDSLASALLASPVIYRVFHAHPTSIIRAVAYNVVGPALPQAVRFLRCEAQDLRLRPIQELLGEDELEKNPYITHDEIRKLVQLSKEARKLEDLLSWREKDHTSRISRLSDAESYQFRRALFTMCLFVFVYGTEAYRGFSLPDDDVEYQTVMFDRLEMRQQFIAAFSTPELKNMKRLNDFFEHLAMWGRNAYNLYDDPVSIINLVLSTHPLPDSLLRAYEGDFESLTSEGLYGFPDFPEDFDDFFPTMVDNVLDKRKISMDAKDILLDQALESSFNCDQCHAEFLTRKRLWGPTDWAYLRGYANPRVMWTLQKGYLSYNHREQYDFCTLWEEQPYETLIHEIFDHKTTAYDAWKKDDLLCMNCLCKFLQEHMHIWYLEWKRKRGAIPTEDCWYGYNCRTQQHNTAHAMKLNHYCEPIRGDAVQTSRTFVLDTVF